MQSARLADDRKVLRISGKDHYTFLQDLVSNDLKGLSEGVVYSALLSPKGKYLFDFFVVSDGVSLLIDVKSDRAAALIQRLTMYRLRADVTLEQSEIAVLQGLGKPPNIARTFADPRHTALGWRAYVEKNEVAGHLAGVAPMTEDDWLALRIEHIVPETGIELIPDDSYILESGFEQLNGVDFAKGCYVGQEITARMKHKTELRKGLARVKTDSAMPDIGTPITVDGKPVGTLYSSLNGVGIAYLRFDRAGGEMQAGDARLTRL